jgi:DtxR family Mn-dependent transcriptional regulator
MAQHPLPDCTPTEENYLKAIYKHAGPANDRPVNTNTVAGEMQTAPASATDMIKKLSEKGLVDYKPYYGAKLSVLGQRVALHMLRKHRLWEVFLVNHLNFSWDEVHETAEQLEHVRSEKLIAKLDEYLGFPRVDPHGDPIPDAEGNLLPRNVVSLMELRTGERGQLAAVQEQSTDFLQYLDRLRLRLGAQFEVIDRIAFDQTRVLRVGSQEIIVPGSVCLHLLVLRLPSQ